VRSLALLRLRRKPVFLIPTHTGGRHTAATHTYIPFRDMYVYVSVGMPSHTVCVADTLCRSVSLAESIWRFQQIQAHSPQMPTISSAMSRSFPRLKALRLALSLSPSEIPP